MAFLLCVALQYSCAVCIAAKLPYGRLVPRDADAGKLRNRSLMSYSPRHILCIDDDQETAELIAEELVDRGFRVSVVHAGQAGIAAIMNETPDLVLSDISMPGISGFDVLQRLLHLAPRFSNMPFVFLTALTDRESELRGRQLGADDYVTKPVDFDILLTIIEARLAGVARRDIWPKQFALNERETAVLTWAARGKTSAEIARILNLTKRTVDFHIDNARAKLNASTRMQAAVIAASGGLIEL
jgi:DNA-binding response OmpR family regulator